MMSTTRRGRYVERQRKYRRRFLRWYRRRRRVHHYAAGVPVYHRAWVGVIAGNGSLQRPPGRSPERGSGPLLPFFSPFSHRHVLEATRFDPPRAEEHTFPHVLVDWGDDHPIRARLGYHVRRVKYRGRRTHKQTKQDRIDRLTGYADRYFNAYGFYPAFDPGQREPQEP